MSQEPELLQDRTISGKGLLKVDYDERKIRYLTLYADVIRQPKSLYLNLNYNPPRSRYATLSFLRDGYLQFTHNLEYEQQSWDFVADYTSQNLIALKCAYSGILESFVNLGAALGATPISVTDLIKDYEYLNLLFDEIKVVCYSSTAIQLRLYATKNDTCEPEKDKPRRPPPPPAPKPPVPPEQPIPDISPPYDPNTDDENDTIPYPDDVPPEPELPPSGINTVVTIVFAILSDGVPGSPITDAREVTTPYYIEIDLARRITLFIPAPGGYTPLGVITIGNPSGAPAFQVISIADTTGYAVDVRYF